MLSDIIRDTSSIVYHGLNGEIQIQNSLVTLTLTQSFQNTSENPLEANYSIPLYKNAVLTSLKIIFSDDSIVDCKVMEKEVTLEKYQDKVSKGHNPIIATQDSNIINLSIGQFPAHDFIEVRIKYTYPLTNTEDKWKFEMLNDFIQNASIKYVFILRVFADSQICEWKSNWDFDYQLKDNILTGFYDSQAKPRNTGNLEFIYKCVDSVRPKCIVQQFEDKFAVMMAFIPYCDPGEDIDDYEGTGEFVFILDRSGSMGGQRINLAKQAATLFIKSLSSKSKFNIVSFGSGYQFMFPVSVFADSVNVANAISQINEFSADMGGTEIYDPLKKIFSQEPLPELPKYVFLLTDGEVESSDMVLELIRSNNKNCKIFSFGIEDANPRFISEAAVQGNGLSYIIKSAADIGKNVIDALAKCVLPFISNAFVNWDCEFVPSLKSLNRISLGKIFSVFTVTKSLPEVNPVFTCFDSLKNRTLDFTIDNFQMIPGDEIFKLWAKQKIDENCEDSLEISLKYQVISEKTALFGCKKNREGAECEIKQAWVKNVYQVSEREESSSKSPTRFYFRLCEDECDFKEDLIYEVEKKQEFIVEQENIEFCNSQFHNSEPNIPDRIQYSPIKTFPEYEPIIPDPIPYSEIITFSEYEPNIPDPIPYSEIITFSKYEPNIPDPIPYSEITTFAKYEPNIPDPIPYSQITTFSEYEPKIPCPTLYALKTNLSQSKSSLYLEIVLVQNTEGFWEWNQLANILNPDQNILKVSESCQDTNVSATALAIAYLNLFCKDSKAEWMLVEKKAIRWLKRIFKAYQPLVDQFSQTLIA